jgi:hypothetical protein
MGTKLYNLKKKKKSKWADRYFRERFKSLMMEII